MRGEDYEPIRSYQRIFRPERRLYAVEGRTLPVPGGVPLRWLAWALGTLLAVIVLSSGSLLISVGVAAAAGAAGLAFADRATGLLAAAATLAGIWLVGLVLGALDWPLRLVVVPIGVATLATQATPDGRRADRFAISWLALYLAPRRRSLGRPLPPADAKRLLGGELWVAPDERGPVLRRARVTGPAVLSFAEPIGVRRGGLRQRRLIAARPRRRHRRGELVAERLVLGERETLEQRP